VRVHVDQDRDQWWALMNDEYGNVYSGSINGGDFVD
jgi:hypothetical protein